MKHLIIVILLPLLCSSLMADDLSDEMKKFIEFCRCPQNVVVKKYLDGGTIGFEITNENFEFYRFCMDGSQFYTKRETENKEQKIYLRSLTPRDENALALPFKGKEEKKLKAIIRGWLKCGKGENIDYLNVLMDALDSERLKELIEIPD